MVFRHVTLDKIICINVSEESVASIFSLLHWTWGGGSSSEMLSQQTTRIYVPEHWNHIYCHENLKSQMHNKIPFTDLLVHLGLQKTDLIIKLSYSIWREYSIKRLNTFNPTIIDWLSALHLPLAPSIIVLFFSSRFFSSKPQYHLAHFEARLDLQTAQQTAWTLGQ